ncbi:MAG: glycosyltransferase family 39 protein, partial [Chitinophagaceae bacterium]
MNFLLLGLKQINQSNHPSFEDTGTYLEGALLIKENGGIGNFINLCLSGKYKVAEQHPLYFMILSPFASRNLSFFPTAQFITLSIGLIGIVCLFFISKRFFDGIVPFLATFLLSLNGSFLLRSSNVAVETVLILLILISWYFMVRGVDKERYWLLSGLAGGLAYMTKGSGLFLIPIFIIATVFTQGIKVVKRREYYLFFLMFLIPCLPWIIRNIIVYGKPIYEGINSHALWLESWGEISRPKYHLIANWKELNYTWSSLPTMGTYINSHSLYEIVKRCLYGVKGELQLVFKSMNLVFNPTGGYIVGITLSILAFFGMLKDENKSRVFYTATTFIIFFVPFSWYYPVVPDDRFITPFLPIFCLYAAFGIQEISNHIDSKLITRGSRFSY